MRALLAIAVSVLLAASSTTARAYHSQEKRTTAGTAFTLQRNEWQLGIFREDYGATDWLSIGTYLMPWVLLAPNVQVKVRLFETEHWALALRPGLFYLDLSLPHDLYGIGPSDTTLKVWVIPVEAYASWTIRRDYTLTFAGVYNVVTGTGTYDPEDFRGTAAGTNAQVGLSFEWRINHITALILQSRLILYQDAQGTGDVSIDVDSRTTAQVRAGAKAEMVGTNTGFSVSLAALFSWRTTNLRIGAGYGNYNAPGLNLVVPERLPFPVFDLFWRFGGPIERPEP